MDINKNAADTGDEKQKVRSFIKDRLSRLSEDDVRAASTDLFDRLTTLPELDLAKVVFCFISISKEPKTPMIIEYLLGRGKKVCVPKCRKNGIMDARILASLSDLVPVPPFGIPEPAEDSEKIDPAEIDFAVIPGLAFDRHGNRLGRGAGYYDRYLRHCRAVRCGICHDIMLLDSIPASGNDVPMDIIVTDKSLIRFRKTEDTNA